MCVPPFTGPLPHFYDLSGERIEKRRPIMGLTLEGRYTVDASYEVDTVAETHQVHLFVGARRVATSKRPGLGTSNGPVVTAADAVEFYHPDHVGSNTLVTDAQGQKVQDSYLTPFGELHTLADGTGSPVSPSDSTTRHLFRDQELDPETGLHYFGARYHDPWIGRFLSQDPELIGPSAGVTFMGRPFWGPLTEEQAERLRAFKGSMIRWFRGSWVPVLAS